MNEEIRTYLAEHGIAGNAAPPDDHQSLLEAGVIDSVVMLDLIAFLEQRYQIVVEEDDMTPENFDSIAAISEYLGGKGVTANAPTPIEKPLS